MNGSSYDRASVESGGRSDRVESILDREPRLKRASQLELTHHPIPGRTCEYCGSKNILESQAKPPHWLEYRCSDCGKHCGFISTPKVVVDARRFVLRFGTYKGLRLGELTTSPKGIGYLGWLRAKKRGEVGRLAALVLSGVK